MTKTVKGFFSTSDLSRGKKPIGIVPKCESCGLYKTCETPKMELYGDGRKNILIVGEAPGKQEDELGKPFVGESGKYLRAMLEKHGVSMMRDCFVTNSLICRPRKDATPTEKQLEYCKPNLLNVIKDKKPCTILTFGGSATKNVVSLVWDKADSSIAKWAGWQIPCGEYNTWICPTFDPKEVVRDIDKRNPVSGLYLEQHIKNALSKKDRPFPSNAPDYKSWVSVIMDDRLASEIILEMVESGGCVGIDLETNRLKPDHSRSEIYTCAVSWNGSKTIAFPWVGAVIPAMKKLLRSKRVKKIAHNLKFEDRWFRRILGISVRNWFVDSMTTAHVIDNRRRIAGLKFQAFVIFGQPIYDSHVEMYLKSDTPDGFNRIKEADLRELLIYNGLDALLCLLLARYQYKKTFGKDILR